MKKIFLQVSSLPLANNKIFKSGDVNNSNSRWIELKSRLKELGYDLITADDNRLDDCEGVIFHDASSLGYPPNLIERIKKILKKLLGIKTAPVYPTRQLYEELVFAGKQDKAVLLIWEGRTICPLNFEKWIWDRFDHILTWDDELLSDPKFIKYNMPIEPPRKIPEAVPFAKKKMLVNISFNKKYYHPNELYSARKRSIEFFDQNYSNDFDLFGPRWNQPISYMGGMFPNLTKKYTNYKGITDDKLGTLSKYKFSLCYENNSGAKGYISEKIFDNFHAGTVPIYWGATNIEEHVDPNTFIDRRKFKDDGELAEFLTKISEKEYNSYLESAKNYLKSEKYARFQPAYFCEQTIKALDLKPKA